jgi:hypothetical protein
MLMGRTAGLKAKAGLVGVVRPALPAGADGTGSIRRFAARKAAGHGEGNPFQECLRPRGLRVGRSSLQNAALWLATRRWASSWSST